MILFVKQISSGRGRLWKWFCKWAIIICKRSINHSKQKFYRVHFRVTRNSTRWSLKLFLTHPMKGFPWDDLRKILPGCQQMASVPNVVESRNIAENFNRLSRAHEPYSYRQTIDRQADGRWLLNNAVPSPVAESVDFYHERFKFSKLVLLFLLPLSNGNGNGRPRAAGVEQPLGGFERPPAKQSSLVLLRVLVANGLFLP